jgi:hypothetical protein
MASWSRPSRRLSMTVCGSCTSPGPHDATVGPTLRRDNRTLRSGKASYVVAERRRSSRAGSSLLFLGCAGAESLEEEHATPCGISERRTDPSLGSCLELLGGRHEQNTSRGQAVAVSASLRSRSASPPPSRGSPAQLAGTRTAARLVRDRLDSAPKHSPRSASRSTRIDVPHYDSRDDVVIVIWPPFVGVVGASGASEELGGASRSRSASS